MALYQLSIVLGILAAYFSNWLLLRFAQAHPHAFGGAGWLHWTLVAEVWRAMFGAEMIPAAALLLPAVPRAGKSPLAGQGGRGAAEAAADPRRGEGAASRADWRWPRSATVAPATKRLRLAELFQPGLRHGADRGGRAFRLRPDDRREHRGLLRPDHPQAAGLCLGKRPAVPGGLGLINLVFTLVAIWKVDSWGRRPLLIWGMAAVTLAAGGRRPLLLLRAGCLPAAGSSSALRLHGLRGLSICARDLGADAGDLPQPGPRPGHVDRHLRQLDDQHGQCLPLSLVRGAIRRARRVLHLRRDLPGRHGLFFWRFVPETKGKSLEEISDTG